MVYKNKKEERRAIAAYFSYSKLVLWDWKVYAITADKPYVVPHCSTLFYAALLALRSMLLHSEYHATLLLNLPSCAPPTALCNFPRLCTACIACHCYMCS